MKKLLLFAMMATMLTSCTKQKVLVLYYSQTGTTQTVAEELQKQLGADIECIEPEIAYDADFQATVERGREEMQSGNLPALKPLQANLDEYDVVFIGFPIWFGTYAMPIATLLRENEFEGKTVVPFCTFGSGGLNTSTQALKEALPKADVRQGYGVRQARIQAAPKEIERFLIENGYKPGKVAPLPEYSEQMPVNEEDSMVFEAACSGYQFPLGTPVTVGKRVTGESTDYKFTAKSIGFDGQEGTTTIFVTVPSEEGAKPEFTEVVR
ncbi:MAG: NAD(P)H-dependent oxidoreductase [Bacteroidaceae bacterium]|nr:NAD(P)H-dependent oxidoreductase [Bacteroidaceae bacterium]